MKVLSLSDNVFDTYRNLNIAYPGGNAVNVAVNASKLNYESYYYGNIASDRYGHHIKQVLETFDVDLSLCHFIDDSSTKLCVEDVIDGERNFIKVDLKENWAGVPKLDISFDQWDVIFSSCNSKIEKEFYKLKDAKGIVSYDFGEKDKYRTPQYFDLIVPYIDIAQFSYDGTLDEYEDIISMINRDIPVLFTRGSKNPILYLDGTFIEGNVNYVEAMDTMGAGDAFICALVTELVKRGWKKQGTLKYEDVMTSLEVASKFSSSICTISGAIEYPLKPKNIEAVIFDMDGVLVDSETHFMGGYAILFKELNDTFTTQMYKDLYGSSDAYQIDYLADHFKLSREEIIKIRDDFFRGYPIDYGKYKMPYIDELLGYLKEKGVKIAIASSSCKKDIEKMMKECHIESFVDLIVTGYDFKNSKPDPEIYEFTVTALNVEKEKIIVVEDSGYGIEAAIRAGLEVYILKNTQIEVDSKKQLKFDSHKDILRYMKKELIW